MFFSVNSSEFGKENPELTRFVLDKNKKYLSNKYQFYIYYNTAGKQRFAGVTGRINVFSSTRAIWSEITFPPFGYVMTLDSQPPDNRLFNITHFSRFDFYEVVPIELRLPVLPTDSPFPGDYRSKEELQTVLAKTKLNSVQDLNSR